MNLNGVSRAIGTQGAVRKSYSTAASRSLCRLGSPGAACAVSEVSVLMCPCRNDGGHEILHRFPLDPGLYSRRVWTEGLCKPSTWSSGALPSDPLRPYTVAGGGRNVPWGGMLRRYDSGITRGSRQASAGQSLTPTTAITSGKDRNNHEKQHV